MKSFFLTILLLFISVHLPAPGSGTAYLLRHEGLKDQRLLNAIIQVESGGDPLQVNYREQALGLLQIRPIMLKEVNRIAGYEKYTTKDCLDSLKSIEIYWAVQNYHNPSNDFRRGAIIWNGKGKTNRYWRKVKNQLK